MDLRRPPADFEVPVELAARLLEAQHPELLTGPVVLVAEGWDNFIFRVGTDLAMRVPRREIAVELLRNEQRWLPDIATRVPIHVPVPVAVGEPSADFPYPWSVVRWMEGTTAEHAPLSESDAVLLAETLGRLHAPAPSDAPVNPLRGVDLSDRRQVVEERLQRMGLERYKTLWQRALGAPRAERAVWLHGDLHPKNVLVRDGALFALIDWGDLTGGDPATDLACAWTLFDVPARRVFEHSYGPGEAAWTRAMGWAVHFGSAMADSGEPAHEGIGRRILDRLAGV